MANTPRFVPDPRYGPPTTYLDSYRAQLGAQIAHAAAVETIATSAAATLAGWDPTVASFFDLSEEAGGPPMWGPLNPSRLTLPVAGVWLLGATVCWAPNAAGMRGVGIRINGTTNNQPAETSVNSGNAAFNTVVSCMGTWIANANDFAEVRALQSSGGNLDVINLDTNIGCRTRFFAFLLAPRIGV